jgi:hypothetical protein
MQLVLYHLHCLQNCQQLQPAVYWPALLLLLAV